MENHIVLSPDKNTLHITDEDDDYVNINVFESKGFKPTVSIVASDVVNLNVEGATALRDFLNQYLVGYE